MCTVFPWRAVARLAVWGIVCAVTVYLAGLVIAGQVLGGNDDAMRARIVSSLPPSTWLAIMRPAR